MICNSFQGGQLVAVVRGANAPLLEKTILDHLEAEKKVLAEGRERQVVSGGPFYEPHTRVLVVGSQRSLPHCPRLTCSCQWKAS